jgi:hypothetical protein
MDLNDKKLHECLCPLSHLLIAKALNTLCVQVIIAVGLLERMTVYNRFDS